MPKRIVLAVVLLVTPLGCARLEQRGPRPLASPGAVTPATAPPAVSSRPNLIVVLSDDHRWDALGAAGNPNVVTPSRLLAWMQRNADPALSW